MKRKGLNFKLGLIILGLAIVFFLLHTYGITYRDVKRFYTYYYNAFNSQVIEYILSFDKFAVFAYILIFILRTLLIIFPYLFMVLLGGSIFGPVKGFAYSMIAVFLSASFAFFISRYLGKDFVQRILKGKFTTLDSKVEKHGFKIIFLMRISTIFPYDIINYAAGLTKVKYRDFILGTMLGMALETFSVGFLGANLSNPFSKGFKIAIGLIVITIVVPSIYNKLKKKSPMNEERD